MADYISLNKIIEKMTKEQREYWFRHVNPPMSAGYSESDLEAMATKVLNGELKESSGPAGEEIVESEIMKDIHQVLNAALEKMNEAQRAAYFKTAKHAPSIESKLNMATHILKNKKLCESRGVPIRRNNGASGPMDQGAIREAEFRQQSDAIMYKRFGIKDPNALPTAIKESSNEFAEQDYAFAKALGMSESDAVKVASDGLIDRGTRHRRTVIKD